MHRYFTKHIAKALICDELRNKSVVVWESFPSDPIPRMTQRDLKEPLFPFVFPIDFDMRLCRRLGTAGFPRIACFDNVLEWLPVNCGRNLSPSDPISHITQRDLKEPSFPFVFPRVFDMRLCKRLGSAWRARCPRSAPLDLLGSRICQIYLVLQCFLTFFC